VLAQNSAPQCPLRHTAKQCRFRGVRTEKVEIYR